jgi:putative FmdB family regulatory protein
MPIYEYVCPKCDHEFEELVASGGRDRKRSCPSCGHGSVTRKLSVFSAQQSSTSAPPMPRGCGSCEQSGSCPFGGF